MRSWIVTATLLVVAFHVQEGVNAKCQRGNREFENGEFFLKWDCSKKFKCNSGEVQEKDGDYGCPGNSECNNGQCVCSNGYITDRESKGLLKSCKRNSDKCQRGNREFNNGDYFLKWDCSKKYKCNSGEVQEKDGDYGCPGNSECNNGQCVCSNGYITDRESKGLLKSCKSNSDKCQRGNREFNNGDYFLKWDCSKKYKCNSGEVQEKDGDYGCPGNSECNNGQCVCSNGYITDRESKGLLKSCKSNSDKCQRGNREFNNGDYFLKWDCSKKYKCNSGEVQEKDGDYGCPGNSECNNGQCVCSNGYITDRESKGLLKSCKSESNKCQRGNREFNNGDYFLKWDCSKKYKCNNGEVQEKDGDYGCPDNSECNNGQCVCSEGFATDRESKGLLKSCERTTFTCTRGNREFNNGDYFLKWDCTKKFKCNNGEIQEKDAEYECPSNSQCNSGQCTCLNGWATDRQSKGLLKSCKRTSSNCQQGNKEFENGNYWLNGDCSVKFKCQNGNINEHDKNYKCPDNSECRNGQCQCTNDYETNRVSKGVLKSCKEKRNCERGGQTYEHGTTWLNDGCRRKNTCRNRNLQSRSHSCPSHSSCKFGGQCVCDFGYETKSVANDGVLRRCKEIESMKCNNGFRRFGSRCLSINKNSRLSFWQAQDRCKRKGGKLLVVDDSYALYQLLKNERQYKDGHYFIMGDTSLSNQNMDDFRNQASKQFVVNMMQRFQCNENQRFKAFKRFGGRAQANDWNFNSPVTTRCMGIDENGPNLFKCSDRAGYICQQGDPESDDDVFWSKWYNVNEPNNKGERESLEEILKKHNNDYNGEADRLCSRPLRMQCREVGTNKLYSRNNDQGIKLQSACTKGKIGCKHSDQSGSQRCPNFEVRFKCQKDDSNDCNLNAVKRNCENDGKVCVQRRTGAACVRQKKQRNKSDKINTDRCFLNGVQHTLYRCKATGDPHYETMDGQKYDFMGVCSYDFVSTCKRFVPTPTFPTFKVTSKNYKRKPGRPSWTKGFALTIGLNSYVFTQGKMHIDGIEVKAVGYEDDVIKIQSRACGKGITLTIVTKFCLRIQWDNLNGLHVFVPEHYKNFVCGLCGDFDGDASNDLTLPGSNSMMSSTDINKEFMVAAFLEQEETFCPIKVEDPEPCADDEKIRLSKKEFCGIFDVDGDSPIVREVRNNADASSLGPNMANLREEFLECINDMCWEPETDRCHDINKVISGIHQGLGILDAALDAEWRAYAGCENTAETNCFNKPNYEYRRNFRPGCQNTCDDPQKSENCEDETEEPGCGCKDGFYMNPDMDCVADEECSKTCNVEMATGRHFQLTDGQEFVQKPCEMIVKCNEGVLEEINLTPCSIHADCKPGGRQCVCHEGYIAAGDDCVVDLSCKNGYYPYGEKCYKVVMQPKDWHSAAITCGQEGSVLARYDDEVGEELVNFYSEIPKIYARARSHNRKIRCKAGGQCSLPRGHVGLDIGLRNRKRDQDKCGGKFSLSDDKKSIVCQPGCEADFNVRVFKESRMKPMTAFKFWVAGNTMILAQNQRAGKMPINIDPPMMVDLSAFGNPNGCFQAGVNNEGELIVSPNPRCDRKKSFICEYDNVGKIPNNPNDFKRLREKGNFQEAFEMCAQLNRPLAAVYSLDQNKKINDMLKQLGGDGWVGGLFATNNFEWTDGNPFKYINWKDREPNNHRGNPRADEQCVAMDFTTGQMYTENCDEPHYPICGPPLNMEPASYTKYYQVKGFRSLPELRQKLAREGKPDYVCREPIVVECSAKEDDGNWRNNFNQRGRAMVCTADNLVCRENEGMDCNTFRVRVMCPSDENQCEMLKGENINPCTGGRSCLPVRNHFVCRCTGDSGWDHKTQSCHQSCGHCFASGDPHYSNFWGDRYDFMGTCMYKFAGVCDLDEFKTGPNFDVYTKNKLCGDRGASCIFYVEVHLRNIAYLQNGIQKTGNFIFKIGRDRPNNYIFNEQEMGIGEVSVPGAFKVVRKNNYFNLISEALSLEVLLSGTKLSLNLPDAFIDKMCGLCGDCSSNKFRKRDGSLVEVPTSGSKLDRQAIIPVVNEWIVPFDGSDPEQCKAVEPIEECTAEMEAQVKGPDMCGIFKDVNSAISDCFDQIDVEPFYNDCVMDACHENPMTAVCGTVRSYAQACMKRKGIIMAWRSGQFCPMDCEDKMYRTDASCEPMCGRDDYSTAVCDEEPEEGCVCPAGSMRQGEECVTPDKCGCQIAISDSQTVTIKPGESRILPRCEEIAKCELKENGDSEEVRESIALDPYAVCIEDPMPRIDCVRGYIMEDDGRTCKRDPEACSEGYEEKSGMCIKVPELKKVWRQAISACNQRDGTLALINSDAKWDEIKKIMEEKQYDQVFISGQIVVKVGDDDSLTYSPVLKSEQRGKIEYYNFDYHNPPVVAIQLSENLDIAMLRGQETQLALVARRGADGGASIVAVPTDTQANFVCEQRYVKPPEEEWYGPCNSDEDMADNGDQESRQSLKKMKDCLVCPVPMDIGCVKRLGSGGTVTGECQMTRSGLYYSCSQGEDCIDYAVETKCARDVDECEEGLHDCPAQSTCKNTIGAYMCKCDADVPIMVKGRCHERQTCTMNGPRTVDDFVYKFTGLTDMDGYVPYACPFKVFETCSEKYNPASGMPLISVYTYSMPQDNGLVQVFGGWIADVTSGKIRHFAVYDSLLRQGKFLYGDDNQAMTAHELGFSCLSVRTSFFFVPPNNFVVHHFDKVFRFGLTFPSHFGIEVSSEYAAMACGMCTYEPAVEGGLIEVTPSQEQYLSGSYMADPSECSIEVQPEPPTTPAPTTTFPPPPPPTTTPAPPTTTTPPPTTEPPTPSPTPVVDNFCEEDIMAFCAALSTVCSVDYETCRSDLCYADKNLCSYLETVNAGECQVGNDMAIFLAGMMNECDGYCAGEDMFFDYTAGEAPERCEDFVDDGESGVGMGAFACTCDDGYKLSGGGCVPQEECGCVYEDGIYLKKDDVLISLDCSKRVVCLGNGEVEVNDMECSYHASCLIKNDVPTCVCDEGFFGDADMPNGCKEPDDEDDTKVCYTRTNIYGIPEITCNCKMGFVSNCTHCVDLDECRENRHDCDLSSEACENTEGSYVCSCANGFEPVNGQCEDIDECKLGLARCKSNAGCVNTPGSFECQCCSGFKYDADSGDCVRDLDSGVDILVSSPKCCLQCDYPDLCDVALGQEQPYCFVSGSQTKQYGSYEAMFKYYCVNNLPLPRSKISEGECPEATTPNPDEDTPDNPSGGDQTTAAGEGPNPTQPGDDNEGDDVTSPSNQQTTKAGPTPTPTPPPASCDDGDFCEKIPPPPPSLSEGPVCGPANQVNKETSPSYCEMVRKVCKSSGGPSNIPTNNPIDADPGACPTTTPPPPPTTTPKQPTPPPAATEKPVTSSPGVTAPDEETPAPAAPTTTSAPVDPLPPSEPLFTDWTPWSRCRVDNPDNNCGVGQQSRTRRTVPYDDDREVLPLKPEDTYEIQICFEPCDTDDEDFDPNVCDVEPGECGENDQLVCASIGPGGPETYANECELNIEACKAGEKPNLISKGECGEEQQPRQMCDAEGEMVFVKHEEVQDGLTCVSAEVEIRRCSHLACEGGFDNCCMATDYDKIVAPYVCYAEGGQEESRGTKVFLSAQACRCSNGEGDEGGP